MPRIAILSSASGGGAGIAARRLWAALCRQTEVVADFIDIATIGERLPESVVVPGSVSRRVQTDTHFTGETSGFVRGWMVSLLADYDFVNVHWASGLVSTSELIEVARLGKPMLITMHDFYYTTGGCHYPAGCTGQSRSCIACPQVDASRFSHGAVSAAFLDKKALLSFSNVHVCAPSSFLATAAVNTGLVPAVRAHVVRNIFEPILPAGNLADSARSKHILLIAASLVERRKGTMLAISALSDAARQRSDLVVHLVGQMDSQMEQTCRDAGLAVISHGKVTDEKRLAEIYRSVGIILTCSLEDNWPNVLVEAGSYGVVPVVGAGHGCEEFCRTFEMGIVVDQYTPAHFATGILKCIEQFPSHTRLAEYVASVRRASDSLTASGVYLALVSEIGRCAQSAEVDVDLTTPTLVSSNYLRVMHRLGRIRAFSSVQTGPFSSASHNSTAYGYPQYETSGPDHSSSGVQAVTDASDHGVVRRG